LALGLSDEFFDVGTTETGRVTRELCQLLSGEIVWNLLQFRLEDRVPALLFWKTDLNVRRESPKAKNRGIDVFRSIGCANDDGRSVGGCEMDE
jgi:hypothetical protein